MEQRAYERAIRDGIDPFAKKAKAPKAEEPAPEEEPKPKRKLRKKKDD